MAHEQMPTGQWLDEFGDLIEDADTANADIARQNAIFDELTGQFKTDAIGALVDNEQIEEQAATVRVLLAAQAEFPFEEFAGRWDAALGWLGLVTQNIARLNQSEREHLASLQADVELALEHYPYPRFQERLEETLAAEEANVRAMTSQSRNELRDDRLATDETLARLESVSQAIGFCMIPRVLEPAHRMALAREVNQWDENAGGIEPDHEEREADEAFVKAAAFARVREAMERGELPSNDAILGRILVEAPGYGFSNLELAEFLYGPDALKDDLRKRYATRVTALISRNYGLKHDSDAMRREIEGHGLVLVREEAPTTGPKPGHKPVLFMAVPRASD